MSIYKENGYNSRGSYLNQMSEDYGIDIDTVLELSDLLGPEEDFDGLIVALDDYDNY